MRCLLMGSVCKGMAGNHETILYTDGGVGPAGIGAAAAITIAGGKRQKLVAFLGEAQVHDAEIFAGLLGIASITGGGLQRILWCCDSTACEATARGADVSLLSGIFRHSAAGTPVEVIRPEEAPSRTLHRSCHRACVWAYKKHARHKEGPIGLIGERLPEEAWLYLDLRAGWRNLTVDELRHRTANVRATVLRSK